MFDNVFRSQERAGVSSVLDLDTYTWASFVEQFGEKSTVAVNGHFDIPPNQLVLGYTRESVTLAQHLGARVEGKVVTPASGFSSTSPLQRFILGSIIRSCLNS